VSPSKRFGLVGLCAAVLAAFFLAPGRSGSSAPDEEVDLSLSEGGKDFTNSVGMKLVRIKAGTFLIGAPAGERQSNDFEKPQYEVEISRDFYVGVYEVTQKQYQAVMGNNPSFFSQTGGGRGQVQGQNTDDFPVEQVSWHDAQKFTEKLSALPRERSNGRKYRLPTEAEWEYCCRAGTKTRFNVGDELAPRDANFNNNNLRRTCKVGSYKPNAFGLYDVHGNVWEWCSDWYEDKVYQQKVRKDPQGPKNPTRSKVQRGGAWNHTADVCRAAFRNNPSPETRSSTEGFRVVCILGRD
jgi:formylglycine-generating enzyme required for sulfatase activity